MKLKLLLKKIKMRFFPKLLGKYEFNDILRLEGIKCGKHTIFYGPETMCIDRSVPFMLEIGDYCKITNGVTILAHDYSPSVLITSHHKILHKQLKTKIGDNVFIGINSVVLMGSSIGDNVIVGAGSVVHGEIPSNVVVAGNPAKIICSLDDYYKKIESSMTDNAIKFFKDYKKRYNVEPTESQMGHFFPIFSKNIGDNFFNGVSVEDLNKSLSKNKPVFDSYDAFKKRIKGE